MKIRQILKWSFLGFVGLIVLALVGQMLGFIPTSEELDATKTVEAQTEFAAELTAPATITPSDSPTISLTPRMTATPFITRTPPAFTPMPSETSIPPTVTSPPTNTPAPTMEEPLQSDSAAETNLLFSCVYILDDDEDGTILGTKRDYGTCEQWAHDTLRQNLREVRVCQNHYNDEWGDFAESVLYEHFETCLNTHGIEYPSLGTPE